MLTNKQLLYRWFSSEVTRDICPHLSKLMALGILERTQGPAQAAPSGALAVDGEEFEAVFR